MTPDLTFLLQAFVIVTVPFVLSRALRLSGMVPLVMIQILVGIALGPSLFGRAAPETYRLLFNPTTLAPLSGAASIAVLFFGFITGLHVDVGSFRGRGRAFAAIAIASVVTPTALGIVGGIFIGVRHPGEFGAHANLLRFSLAIGICVGVTALPVLAAVLREMGLLGQRIGHLALGIAAVNDAALWLLLGTLMTAIAGAAATPAGVLVLVLGLPVYLLVMVGIVKPALAYRVTALAHDGKVSEAALVVIGAAAIGSAMATQIIGLHFIFGAFVAGAVVPRQHCQAIADRLETMTIGVLMPFFFMLTGLRILVVPSSAAFMEVLLVTAALGVIGKVGGTAAVATLVGERWRNALCLGVLVQTKGLMEVVVLTILLEQEIISTTVFSALVVMAVISTAPVMPLARLLLTRTWRELPAQRSERKVSA